MEKYALNHGAPQLRLLLPLKELQRCPPCPSSRTFHAALHGTSTWTCVGARMAGPSPSLVLILSRWVLACVRCGSLLSKPQSACRESMGA
jgi:hypothetical protein